MKTRTDFFTARDPHRVSQAYRRLVPGLKGGSMNRIEKKESAVDAAKLFQEEVRELMPGIPRKELCDMVDDYIYYQTDDMRRDEAHAIVEATCTLNQPVRP
jgi:hypothetical protein